MVRPVLWLMVPIAIAWTGGPSHAQSTRASSLAGRYSWGDGLGYRIGLELDGLGRYHATWNGCLGEYGTAEGRWSASGPTIHFRPSKETGMMQGHLRQARFTRRWGKVEIEREDDDARTLGKDGKSKYPISRRRAIPREGPAELR